MHTEHIVKIEDGYQDLTIIVNDKKFVFEKNQPFNRLPEVFKELGIINALYEEVLI